MKSKIFGLIAMLCIVWMPNEVFASSSEYELVSESTKYYKTVTYYRNDISLSNIMLNANYIPYSETIEITEDEYLNADEDNYIIYANPVSVETTYKKMTSSILSNGSYYRYKNVLVWKNMPATRSYDIIAIGFFQSVKLHGSSYFLQEYCYTSGTCSSTTSNSPQVFSSGAGTTFKLPTGTLSSLSQTFYFDVEKNTTSTIASQYAYSDYAHATSTISLANAKKYTVSQSLGIVLDSSVESYYDTISTANASWSGSW